jgi:hypothetical protein
MPPYVNATDKDILETPARKAWHRVPVALALAGSIALAASLSFRNLAVQDIGYHLAYGDVLLDEGRIVDSSDFTYLLKETPNQWSLGPACWRDAQGRYRFVNANWLTQALFSAVHGPFGWTGLALLQASLALGCFAFLLAAMRRMCTGWVSAAAGLFLIAVTAQSRLMLRPEMTGFVIFAVQIWLLSDLLAGRSVKDALPAWKIALLIATQILWVNLHSYYLLGLFLTGPLALAAWGRYLARRRKASEPQETSAAWSSCARLSLLLLGQLAATMVNPWGWRMAWHPIATTIFLRRHVIGQSKGLDAHPWAMISEIHWPFSALVLQTKTTFAYVACLCLGASGIAVAVYRRKWACALILVGMTMVSLSMRRNIAPFAMAAVPLALGMLAAQLRRFPARSGPWLAIKVAVALVTTVLSVWLTWQVVTSRYWYSQRMPERFGFSRSRIALPVDAARWLNEHKPRGPLWTDYTSSSNFHYFTDGRYEVPILTNTWAYPPEAMALVLDVSLGKRPAVEVLDRYGVEIVALRADATSGEVASDQLIPLMQQLQVSPEWVLVHVDAFHVVFLRAGQRNAALAAAERIDIDNFDAQAHADWVAGMDPIPAHALYAGAVTLDRLGMRAPAEVLYRRSLRHDGQSEEAWNMLGRNLALQALFAGATGRDKLLEARHCFQKVLKLDPDHPGARENLQQANRQLAALEAGRPWVP